MQAVVFDSAASPFSYSSSSSMISSSVSSLSFLDCENGSEITVSDLEVPIENKLPVDLEETLPVKGSLPPSLSDVYNVTVPGNSTTHLIFKPTRVDGNASFEGARNAHFVVLPAYN